MADDDPWNRDDAEALRVAVGSFVRAARRRDALPGAQAAVLGFLDREGPLSISALAERGRVRHQSMRETVQLLCGAGAVTRRRSAEDGRVVVCSITPDGRRVLRADRRARTTWILKAVNGRLTPGERALARRIGDLLDAIAADR